VVTPTGTVMREQTKTKIVRYCDADTCSVGDYYTGRVKHEIVAPDDAVHETIRSLEYDPWGNIHQERTKGRSGQPGETNTPELVTTYTYDAKEHLFAVKVQIHVVRPHRF
jgi:hypothetical protein